MLNSGREKTGSVRKIFSSQNFIWFVIGFVALTVIAVIATSHSPSKTKTAQASGPCGLYRNDKTVRLSGETIGAEIPNSPQAYAKGLGGRPCILPGQGMLFVFSKPGQYRFWMKDMKFPIDIIWISKDFKVAGIEADVEPSTYFSKNPIFINDKDHLAQYVLELKANRSTELHLSLGTSVQF